MTNMRRKGRHPAAVLAWCAVLGAVSTAVLGMLIISLPRILMEEMDQERAGWLLQTHLRYMVSVGFVFGLVSATIGVLLTRRAHDVSRTALANNLGAAAFLPAVCVDLVVFSAEPLWIQPLAIAALAFAIALAAYLPPWPPSGSR